MFCRHCGVSISDNSKFCPKCGTSVIRDDVVKNDMNNTVNVPEANAALSSKSGNIKLNKPKDTVPVQDVSKLQKHKPAKESKAAKEKVSFGFLNKKVIILTCVTAAVGAVGFWVMPQYVNDLLFGLVADNTSDPQLSVMMQLASGGSEEKILKKKLALANRYSGTEEYGAAAALLAKLEYNNVESAGDEIDDLLEENSKALIADSKFGYAFSQSNIISDNDRAQKCINNVYLSSAQKAYEDHDMTAFMEKIKNINKTYSYDEAIYSDLLYKCAVEEFNAGNYDKAAEVFTEIKSYSDASDYIQKCYYEQGEKLLGQKDYLEAASYFKDAGSYSDSKDKYKECNYQYAETLYDKEQYELALDYYNKVTGYKKTTERIKYCKYYLGIKYYNKKDYEAAKRWFSQIKGFEYTDTYLSNIEKLNDDGWFIVAWTCDDEYIAKTSFSTYDNFNLYICLYNEYYTDKSVKIRTVITDSEGTTSTDYATKKSNDRYVVSFNYESPYWVTATSATFKVYVDSTNELLGSYTIYLW